ncbi:MAG: hypothetical protein C5B46_01105 [Proteobacteria bacterium]|nr:MAG: hypothetical protein C5B46_01105 [Pseudomonadota bacterium]
MSPRHALAWITCVPIAAAAADWVKMETPDAHSHWYDQSKLVFEGDSVTYWRRVQFRSPQRSKSGLAVSAMYRERVECRAHSMRTLGYLLYGKDRNVIENTHTPEAPAEPVVPETLGDQYEKLMCALASQRPPELRAPPSAGAIPRSAQEIRDEIEWLDARLRILREQLDLKLKAEATGPSVVHPAASH